MPALKVTGSVTAGRFLRGMLEEVLEAVTILIGKGKEKMSKRTRHERNKRGTAREKRY